MNPEENPTPTAPSPNDTPVVESQSTVSPPTEPQVTVGNPSGPVVSAPVTPTPGGKKMPSLGGFVKKKWFIPAVVAAVVLLGGGYVFAFYIPNQPSNVYNSGLTNSGKALDKLISYEQTQSKTHYKSVAFDGKATVKASGASFDATLNGAFDSSANGTLQLKADVEGQNITANIRSIKAAGNTSPDLYLQVSGVKSILDTYGLGSLDSQWVSVDHTLLDTYTKQAGSIVNLDAFSTIGGAKTSMNPTPDQINDAITKIQTVNKQYIFTTDSSKAVLVKQKFVGKETKDGRSVDHFLVGYNQAHLASYLSALKTAADSSSLNDWAKKVDNGKSISEALNLDQAIASVKSGKNSSSSNFDLFVDTKTKLIESVQVTDSTDKTTKVSFGQTYNGGSVYPFFIGFSDSTTTGKLGLSVDTATNAYKVTFDFSEGSTLSANVSVDITPGNKTVNVTAPAGAKSLTDVLSQLGLGSDALGGASAGSDSSLFSLTQ